jgi:predicted O-methyltransferase YrrM
LPRRDCEWLSGWAFVLLGGVHPDLPRRKSVNALRLAESAIRDHGAIQKAGELASFLALLMDDPPRTVVEVGSDAGGTLWAWQQLGAERVIGVDMPGGRFGSGVRLNDHGCEIVYGDSHDIDTLAELVALLELTPVDMLFIDGDHTYEGVKADFELYSPLVRPGGVIAFHDICIHPLFPEVQVFRLWLELEGMKEEIVTRPASWGGIGVIRVPALVAA